MATTCGFGRLAHVGECIGSACAHGFSCMRDICADKTVSVHAGLDPEMKKTFDELQNRMVEMRSQIQFTDFQAQQRSNQIKHKDLTLTEIKT